MFDLSVVGLQRINFAHPSIIIEIVREMFELDGFIFSSNKIEGILSSINFEKSICPHCGSGNFIKHGKTSLGRQRYRCRECRKTFSETTGTPFMYSKKTLKTWASYLFCMEGRLTLRKISKLLEMNLSTAFAWRHNILIRQPIG